MSGSLRPINLGVPDITVVVRENSDANKVLIDVPNISVNIETSPDYKVSVQPSSLVVQRTGSLPSLAVSALFANTASYALGVSGSIDNAISASFATTASYALNAITTLPVGVVSSSGQINTGSFTGSFTGVLIGTSSWASNVISSSFATTASYAVNAASVPAGTVSSSTQVVTYVSGSTIVPNRVESNEYKLIAGAVSLIFTGSITSGIFGATEYILPFIPTSSFCATTVEYVASRVGGLRVGIILAGWSGSNTTVTDISSTDVGDTSDIRFSLVQSDGYIKLRVESLGSGSYPWTVQSLFKLFPFLS